MKKVLVVGIIVLFLGFAFSSSTANIVNRNISTNNELSSHPLIWRTIYVDDDNTEGPWDGSKEHPFRTIQDGVNKAEFGDKVFVFNGKYNGDIWIEESMEIMGESKQNTILYGEFIICAPRIKIHGFTIHGWAFGIDIRFWYSSFAVITDNIITDADISGIIIRGLSSFITITNNIIRNNERGICFTAEDGRIYNKIYGNTIENNEYGLVLDWSLFTKIKKNNFIKNGCNAIFEDSYMSRWSRNYWDDWIGFGPYPIKGRMMIPIIPYDPYYINLYNFDWRPAKEPYKIPSVIECDID